MTDLITIGEDKLGTFYQSQVWGELTEQEFCNYLQNLRNEGRVYHYGKPEKISNEVIRLVVTVR